MTHDLERELLLLKLSQQFTKLEPIAADAVKAPDGYKLVLKAELSNDNWLHAGRSLNPNEDWEGFLNGHHFGDLPQPMTAREAALMLQNGDLLCLPLYPEPYLPNDVDKRNLQDGKVVIADAIASQINHAGNWEPTQIDFQTIAKFEGGQIFRGYVPLIGGTNKSRMTISTGFDLGQLNPAYIKHRPDIEALLKKYQDRFQIWVGRAMEGSSKAMVMETIRKTGPVPTITAAEANDIDLVVMSYKRDQLIRGWEHLRTQLKANGIQLKAFSKLTAAWQTVLQDITYQGNPIFHVSGPEDSSMTVLNRKDSGLVQLIRDADAAAVKKYLKNKLDHPDLTPDPYHDRRAWRCGLLEGDQSWFFDPPANASRQVDNSLV